MEKINKNATIKNETINVSFVNLRKNLQIKKTLLDYNS